MNKKFSLIELIVVIAIIGILASIIVPNIQTLKSDANITSIKANTRVFQTAVDMYSLKNNGLYPAKEQPTIFVPQPIDVEILYPKYLKTLPKDQGGKYWVDYMGKVWGSTVDAPIGINYEPTEISWEAVEGSNEYGVYQYEGTSPTGFLGSKNEFAKFKGNITVNNKTASYTREANTVYLVNSIDQYGLETAPVGNGYEGYDTQFPITGTGDFYFTTNAGGTAVWDGIQKTEITPTGTSITYSYATSNDGKTYTSYITDFKSLPNSRYLKVKATMTSINETKPTIKRLKVLFHLIGSQGTDENSNEIDIIGKINGPQSSNVVTDTTNNKITIVDGQTQGTVTHIIPIPTGNTVTDVITSVTNPNGGSGIGGSSGTSGQVQTGVGNGTSGNSGYIQYYQISTDGGSTWQPATPTPYIHELPSGGTHIKIITIIIRPSTSASSPTLDNITIVSAKPPQSGGQTGGGTGGGTNPTENWQLIEEKEFVVDATEQGDWISMEKTDIQPANTRITYTFAYSNDDVTWSSAYTDITQVPNSRLLKVIARLEKTPAATQNPSITEILVNYNIVRTGQPISYKTNNPQSSTINHSPIAAIVMNMDQGLTTSSNIVFSYTFTDEDNDTISSTEWQINTNPVQTAAPNGTFSEGIYTVKLRIKDSQGLWSSWVERQFTVINGQEVKQIETGTDFTVALLTDGTVKAWGSNTYGQLGNGTNQDSLTPVTVSNLTDVSKIFLGEVHAFAILTDGTVKAWGSNNNGRLGDGSNTHKNTPVTLNGLTNVKEIAGGQGHTIALLNDGTVKAWGDNYSGQLGNGTGLNSSTPITVNGLSNVKQISAGGHTNVALLNDGTVKGWGGNSFGQLGNGTTTDVLTPITVNGLSNVKQISAGVHVLAVLNDGTVKGIGRNDYGQLGDGTYVNKNTFTTINGLTNIREIKTGTYHSIAILNDGTIKTTGHNGSGQLGDGTTSTRNTFVMISGLSNVKQISAEAYHTFALLEDNTVKAWGDNNVGQLGDGTKVRKTSPVTILNSN